MTLAPTAQAASAPTELEDIDHFQARVRSWLEKVLPRKQDWSGEGWGHGSDAVPVFNNYDSVSGRALMDAAAAWQQQKYDAGFAALTLPVEDGGRGLPTDYARVYAEIEAEYAVPQWDELLEVTVDLVGPTLAVHGTEEMKQRYVADLLSARVLACQLFSEPGAGSDLAALTTAAVRTDSGSWRINGQKVWSSGSQFADLGLLIARTDPANKHRGMTAFMVEMDTPGLEVRPIKQMTGGQSFNEIFFTDVEIPDTQRVGEIGEGWPVALTTLRFEREHAATLGGHGVSELFGKVSALAVRTGRDGDPLVRQRLGSLFQQVRSVQLVSQRVQESMRAGEAPGPEGSMGKLLWSQALLQISDLVTLILREDVIADSGEWGRYTWSQHLLGAPGFRIAGGSDEIQRTIVAERVLGLPREPRP